MTSRKTRTMWILLGLVAAATLSWTLTPKVGAWDRSGPSVATLAQSDHPLGEPDKDKSPRYRHDRPPLSEKQIDEALSLLEELHPELAQKLEAHRDEQSGKDTSHREHVGSIIHRHFPRLRHLLHLKETDPPMYELRVEDVRLTLESRRLAEQYTEALHEDDDRRADQLRDQLHAQLEEHFEIRQRLRQLELQRLEQRIDALREQIEAREDDRDDVIEQRLHELVGTDDGARW